MSEDRPMLAPPLDVLPTYDLNDRADNSPLLSGAPMARGNYRFVGYDQALEPVPDIVWRKVLSRTRTAQP